MVYVISKDGHPLMPTVRHGKVRRLLKENKAIVVKRCPFTIKLTCDTPDIVQEVTLGVDAGSKHIGLSATTETKELYASEVELRDDISKLLEARREYRSSRRNRKTRYRKARFENRVKSKHKGWLAPSVEAKIGTHVRIIENVCNILPIKDITVEVASFDTQKMQDPEITGIEYQQGTLMGYTIREYLAEKFDHKCCYCGKPQGNGARFEVEHFTPKSRGGSNRITNLGWSCHECNEAKGNLTCEEFGHPEVRKKAEAGMKHASHMSIMRWKLYERLKALYGDRLHLTYGSTTLYLRHEAGLEKSHINDARCISGHSAAEPAEEYFYRKKVRRHNRQIHKLTIQKGGIRKRNQAPYEVKGFRLFDKVKAKGSMWYIHGRRVKGSFVLKTLEGEKLEIAPSKITLIGHQSAYITERRTALLPAL